MVSAGPEGRKSDFGGTPRPAETVFGRGRESVSCVFFPSLFLWTLQESWIPGASNDESMMNHESVGFLFVYFTHTKTTFRFWFGRAKPGTGRGGANPIYESKGPHLLCSTWGGGNQIACRWASHPPEGIRYQPELGRFFQPRYCRLCLDFSPLARVLASI